MRTILNVAPGLDGMTSRFSYARSRYINDVAGEVFDADTLPPALADKPNLLSYCERRAGGDGSPLYDAICFATHGSANGLETGHGDILFSVADTEETLAAIAGGRDIYICACEAASGDLPAQLASVGCKLFVGFTISPHWQTTDGAILWSDLDVALLRSVASGLGGDGVERVRENYLRVSERDMGRFSEMYDADLQNVASALTSMVINQN